MTNRDARERLRKASLGHDIREVYPTIMDGWNVSAMQADLRALLSEQPLPSVATGRSEDQGASRDHALTVGDGQGNPTLAASDTPCFRCKRCGRDEIDCRANGCERGPCPMEFVG